MLKIFNTIIYKDIGGIIKMNLYCLYDRISGKYGPIVEMENDASIARALRTVKDPVIVANPGDFDVYALGEKDDQSGIILPKCEFLFHITEVLNLNGNGKENKI